MEREVRPKGTKKGNGASGSLSSGAPANKVKGSSSTQGQKSKVMASTSTPNLAKAAPASVPTPSTSMEALSGVVAIPSAIVGLQDGENKAKFLQKVQNSSLAIQKGEFAKAVKLYTEALQLDPGNYILFSNRSAAFVKLGLFDKALKDARKSRELNQQWSKAYYREGIALQCMGRVADALAAYAAGLAQEPDNAQLLTTFTEAALASPLKEKFGPIYSQLAKMKLSGSAFVVLSVVGQELLSLAHHAASVAVLEAALRVGSRSLKLRGSVFSALSTAHWGLGQIDKAIACMQQDLAIAKSLGDQEGECRAHGNLGAAYFSKGNYHEALQHHRLQLLLATRHKDHVTTATALGSLGHVYTAVGDYPNALANHRQCVMLVKQSKQTELEAREIGNVGAVYLAMGNVDSALACHNEHLKLARQHGDKREEARAYSNLGSAHHYRRDFEKAVMYHTQVLNLSLGLSDRTLEARAYAGLGHAARCMNDVSQAKYYHEKQLDNALQTKDKVAEGRACSNLGIIYQNLGEFDAALKLHKAHLTLAKHLGDRASQGRAYGNIGNAYSRLGDFDLAVSFHKQELAISKEVGDKHSEMSTHGNLAVAYQSLSSHDKAVQHYTFHLSMARELKDTTSEVRALSNFGNYHSSRRDFRAALPFYEQYLQLSQELHDVEGEGKACHKLGYVHFSLGHHREAVRYYEQDLALAKETKDNQNMCRAYCNLGLAHTSLEEYPKALEYQKYFLAAAHMTKNTVSKFYAVGNIGDVHMKMGDNDEAIKMFDQQLTISRQLEDKKLEAVALGNMGTIHKVLGHFDKALGYHTQELTIYQEISDLKGECKAHSHLGNIHVCLGNYSNAGRCYEEQLDRSRELKNCSIEANAYGNLGITKVNLGHFDDAIGYFEQQLAMLEQGSGHQASVDKGRSYGNLGDCYEAIRDYDEAVKCYEQYLSFAQNCGSLKDQDRAYRGLGHAYQAMGSLQQALVCFEKRLVIAHELNSSSSKSSAYGELGCLHSLLGNFEQATSTLQQQLRLARELGDEDAEAEAACGLGGVYQQMAEHDKALEYHTLELQLATKADNQAYMCRAYGNLGLAHESLGNYDDAIEHQQRHLDSAIQLNDRLAKTLAYSSLGRVLHAMARYEEAVEQLEQGLAAAEQLGSRQDEAKVRHRLGLALWGQGRLGDARDQLYSAVALFEEIRREAQFNNEYKLSLFDLQTASYQALQRVLVALGCHDDALVVAERGRTRAFVDLLMERQQGGQPDAWHSSLDSATPVSLEAMVDTVTSQRAAVLYFSMAAGFLYSWLILPDTGVVRFHESSVSELEAGSDPEDTVSLRSFRSLTSTTSLLDTYVGQAREALGIEAQASPARPMMGHGQPVMSETESEADDLWQQHLHDVGDRLNAENDRTGFLRMVNRNHVWNASSLSLGSMLSLSGSSTLGRGSARRRAAPSNLSGTGDGRAPLAALYDLLIAPFEDVLPPGGAGNCRELILVLQGDLYLVPFALLRSAPAAPSLCERYNLLVAPSVRAMQASQAISRHSRYNPNCTGAVVIGNPKLPKSVATMWQWPPLPGTEQECRLVAEMMGCRSLTGPTAIKDSVMQKIQRAELLHFSTHISWKLAAIVLSASDFSTTSAMHGNLERMDLSDSTNDISASFDGPPLSDFLLTAADVLNIRISAKLVVLSSGHTDERAGRVNTDGVVGLTRAFLAAGAQCVLLSLWPVPESATLLLLKSFYTALLQGARCSQALGDAMRAVQASRQFAHPSNWASWVLIGSDVRLSSKVALMGHAFGQILKTPAKSRDGMRVVLHLVEKTLQRIHANQRNAMYTTQQSIENRVGDMDGWRELLTSVGFRFEAATGTLPAAVFFPTSDPGDRLTQCSASLQALLGLSVATLSALSQLVDQQEVGEVVTNLLHTAHTHTTEDGTLTLPVPTRLWRAPGVHEFLASLGFDLVDVGDAEVTLRAGKHANRRTLQFAAHSMVAVFDTQEAARTLPLDTCSSLESLCSSGTSTSNFSKGSSPPTSPTMPRPRSFFNPAEVEKLPTAARLLKVGSPTSSPQADPEATVSVHLSLQSAIKQKYSSGSDMSDANQDPTLGREVDLDIALTTREVLPAPVAPPTRNKVRQTPQERSASCSYLAQSARLLCSTSASDSEDTTVPENNLSRLKSRSSQSLASVRSAGSAGAISVGSAPPTSAFRRTKARGSVSSLRSSASDRTLTNDSCHASQETLVDSKTDLAEQLQEVKKKLSPPKPPPKPMLRVAPRDVGGVAVGDKKNTKGGSGIVDPETLAMKVIAETQHHRYALEAMQHWRVQELQEKRDADADANTATEENMQERANNRDDHVAETCVDGEVDSQPEAESQGPVELVLGDMEEGVDVGGLEDDTDFGLVTGIAPESEQNQTSINTLANRSTELPSNACRSKPNMSTPNVSKSASGNNASNTSAVSSTGSNQSRQPVFLPPGARVSRSQPVLANRLQDHSLTVVPHSWDSGLRQIQEQLQIPMLISSDPESAAELSVIEEETEFSDMRSPEPRDKLDSSNVADSSMGASSDEGAEGFYDERAVKGAMKRPKHYNGGTSGSDSGSQLPTKPVKSVKFQDEIVSGGALVETLCRDVSRGNHMDSVDKRVFFDPELSVDEQIQVAVNGRHGIMGPPPPPPTAMQRAPRRSMPAPPPPTIAPPLPVPTKMPHPTKIPHPGGVPVPPSRPVMSSFKPVPQPILSIAKAAPVCKPMPSLHPPPYPGQRRQGSQDSTHSSSASSALMSDQESSQSTSSGPSFQTPILPHPRHHVPAPQSQYVPMHPHPAPVHATSAHPNNTKATTQPTRHQNLQPATVRPPPMRSPPGGHYDDFNSPANLQKAAMQFYQPSPSSASTPIPPLPSTAPQSAVSPPTAVPYPPYTRSQEPPPPYNSTRHSWSSSSMDSTHDLSSPTHLPNNPTSSPHLPNNLSPPSRSTQDPSLVMATPIYIQPAVTPPRPPHITNHKDVKDGSHGNMQFANTGNHGNLPSTRGPGYNNNMMSSPSSSSSRNSSSSNNITNKLNYPQVNRPPNHTTGYGGNAQQQLNPYGASRPQGCHGNGFVNHGSRHKEWSQSDTDSLSSNSGIASPQTPSSKPCPIYANIGPQYHPQQSYGGNTTQAHAYPSNGPPAVSSMPSTTTHPTPNQGHDNSRGSALNNRGPNPQPVTRTTRVMTISDC